MKKILIVDDHPEVRRLVAVTLRVDDYLILEASNGLMAVEVALAEIPDLIIMDVMMPGVIDGFEAVRRIRRDERTCGCKVVMLTAKGQAADREEGLLAGADDYFHKPFSPLDLIRKVEEFMK